MKAFFVGLFVFVFILSFAVAVSLYNVNSSLPDNQVAVFSFDVYFNRLLNVDFPEYDFGSVIAVVNSGIDEDTTYSYDDVVNVIRSTNISFLKNIRIELKLGSLLSVAKNAYSAGIEDYVTWQGIRYTAVVPADYESPFDVQFKISASSNFIDRIAYTIRYIGQCISSIGKFCKSLLPFDSYEIIVIPRYSSI